MLPGSPPRMSWLQRRRGPSNAEVRGWRRDPHDVRFMRHWNGRTWSREVRIVPSWIAGGPPPLAPQKLLRAEARRKRRAAALLSLASAFSGIAAVAAFATVGDLRGLPDAPKVNDEEFLSLAAAACNEAAGDVAEIPRPEAGDSAERTARYVERVADRYNELVGDLSVLPVAARDEAAVEEWTTSFAGFTAAGRRYASALRSEGDRTGADSVRQQGNPYKRKLLAFAFENRLPETCVPR